MLAPALPSKPRSLSYVAIAMSAAVAAVVAVALDPNSVGEVFCRTANARTAAGVRNLES